MGNGLQRIIGKFQLHTIQIKERLILLYQRVLRLRKNLHQCLFRQSLQRYRHRHTTDKLRNQTKFGQILRHYLSQKCINIHALLIHNLRIETNGTGSQTILHNLLQTVKGTAADK